MLIPVSQRTKRIQTIWVVIIATLTASVIIFLFVRPDCPDPRIPYDPRGNVFQRRSRMLQASRFAAFNNDRGAANGELIIPNIVHFLVFNNPTISFVHFVCILAALKNQRPDKIYFHTNLDRPGGEYWKRLMALKTFADSVVVRKMALPTEIFNQTIRAEWNVFHGSDIARMRVLMEFGGIYIDNDSYIIKCLDVYRKFEIALAWDEKYHFGNQIIVTHKDARFLDLWLHTYDGTYNGDRWYYNAGILPAISVLSARPDLVHRVKSLFGTDKNAMPIKLYQYYWPGWKEYYAIHLLTRKAHQKNLHNISEEATYPIDFDEYNIQKYPITFREMVNDVLDYEKALSKKEEHEREGP